MGFSISVIIPFYKAEKYFEEALDSIKNQTVKVNEIIVINDGCGSKTTGFLEKFDGIKIINVDKNGGASSARNIGIKAAKYDWIAFLDADDIWLPDKIEGQLAFLSKHPQFSACHTGISTFNNSGGISEYNSKPFNLTINDLLVSSHVTPPSLLIKKSALTAVNYFDEKMQCSEDYDLSIRLLIHGYNIGFINKTLTKVRRMNHGNLSSNSRRVIRGHLQLFKKHKKLFLKQKGASPLFIYSVMMAAGGKSKGLEKKLYYALGKSIKIIFRIK